MPFCGHPSHWRAFSAAVPGTSLRDVDPCVRSVTYTVVHLWGLVVMLSPLLCGDGKVPTPGDCNGRCSRLPPPPPTPTRTPPRTSLRSSPSPNCSRQRPIPVERRTRTRHQALTGVLTVVEMGGCLALAAASAVTFTHNPCPASLVAAATVGATGVLSLALHIAVALGRRSAATGALRRWRACLCVPSFLALWSSSVTRDAPPTYVTGPEWGSQLAAGCAWAALWSEWWSAVCWAGAVSSRAMLALLFQLWQRCARERGVLCTIIQYLPPPPHPQFDVASSVALCVRWLVPVRPGAGPARAVTPRGEREPLLARRTTATMVTFIGEEMVGLATGGSPPKGCVSDVLHGMCWCACGCVLVDVGRCCAVGVGCACCGDFFFGLESVRTLSSRTPLACTPHTTTASLSPSPETRSRRRAPCYFGPRCPGPPSGPVSPSGG
jgi:hypothetical protein